jgi:hypothetical protein
MFVMYFCFDTFYCCSFHASYFFVAKTVCKNLNGVMLTGLAILFAPLRGLPNLCPPLQVSAYAPLRRIPFASARITRHLSCDSAKCAIAIVTLYHHLSHLLW